ncbi:MAG TPA: VOC family protein [Candidatus Limnocylindrales bacterium]|nr:VOC family protein [Candidatus Limnocylindrales bacterium]
MAIGYLASVVLDCDDPGALADFWVQVVGGEIAFRTDEFVAIKTGHIWLATFRVSNYQPPAWPKGQVPKQLHLDVSVTDLDKAQNQALAFGARLPADQPSPDRWRVLLDPAGHPFCLSIQIPEI